MSASVDRPPVNTDDCWLFARYLFSAGYGAIWNIETKKQQVAHRFMYENLVGDIPEGMELDHLCKVKVCINPDHLEPVTRRENNQRKYGVGLCKRGHELIDANVRWYRGKRNCSICAKWRRDTGYKFKKEAV